MAMRIFDFECDGCGHVSEELVHHETRSVECDCCGDKAVRKITPVRFKLDGTDPDFPGAYSKWAKDREKELKNRRKRDLLED